MKSATYYEWADGNPGKVSIHALVKSATGAITDAINAVVVSIHALVKSATAAFALLS